PVRELPAHIAKLRAFLNLPEEEEAPVSPGQAPTNCWRGENFPAQVAETSEPRTAGAVELS
ncbi:MAG: hypothetical protein ABJI65_18000, partial [Tateyamaria sp.]